MTSPTTRGSNTWQVEGGDDVLQIKAPNGHSLSGIDSTGAGFGALAGGGGGTPGGADTEIQFNNHGAFGGDANLSWDPATGTFLAEGGPNSVSQFIAGTTGGNGIGVQGELQGNKVILLATETAASSIDFEASANINIESDGGDLLLISDTGAIVLGSTKLKFFDGNPTDAVVKPTVTGSKGGNAALASLLTALVALGLITDSTT